MVPALPVAVGELRGFPLYGWAFSAFMLAWMIGTVGGGRLADLRGPRAPMAYGLCGFGAGLLLAGTAHEMGQFLTGRALSGLGGGAMLAAAYVAIARGYPDGLRPRVMSLTASVWIVPAVVGPGVSGAVAEFMGWRYVFVGIVPFLFIVAWLALPPLARLDREKTKNAEQPDVGDEDKGTRLLLAIRAVAGVTLFLSIPSLPSSKEHGWGLLLLAGLVAAALAIPALRALLPVGTFVARRGLPTSILCRGLLGFSFFGTEAFLPRGAGELQGVQSALAGLALTAGAIGWITASWAQDGWRLERETAGSEM